MPKTKLDQTAFQTSINGKHTKLFFLKSLNGIQAAITNYGGRVVSILVPDGSSNLRDVAVGFSNVQSYQQPSDAYYGAIIGRYGNRIAKGEFVLDGITYHLNINNGENALHGGPNGFHNVVWDAEQPNKQTLILNYLSKDMEEGFPGNLDVSVTYTITDTDLTIKYEAVTNKKTVVNLTNHTYFNLNGEGEGSIINHHLMINADHFIPIDEKSIPFGNMESVYNTPLDFTMDGEIGKGINQKHHQLINGSGYDHTFVLNKNKEKALSHAATVKGDVSGIIMEVLTTEPGMQFYTGNFMQSLNTFKSGAKDDRRTAFCLETQHFPDSPNQDNFPSTVLHPGERYESCTIYRFSN